MRFLSLSSFVVVGSFLPVVACAATPACVRILDVPGATTATVTGSVGSDEPFPCYEFTGAPGRTARLRVAGGHGNVAFTVDDVADDRDSLDFPTKRRSYTVTVFQTLRAPPARYDLTVSLR